MTPRQFQIEFERSASYIDEVKNDSIRIISDDVNYYLNEALHVFVTNKLKVEQGRSGLKRSQRELDEIRELVVKNTVLSKDNALSTTSYSVYTLPTDYLFLLGSSTITTHCEVQNTYSNRMYGTDKLGEILSDTHYGTKYNSPVADLASNKLYIYRNSSFTIDSVLLDYVKDYTRIDVINDENTELNESTHKDIVQLAVTIFQNSISSGKFRETVEKNILTKQIKSN